MTHLALGSPESFSASKKICLDSLFHRSGFALRPTWDAGTWDDGTPDLPDVLARSNESKRLSMVAFGTYRDTYSTSDLKRNSTKQVVKLWSFQEFPSNLLMSCYRSSTPQVSHCIRFEINWFARHLAWRFFSQKIKGGDPVLYLELLHMPFFLKHVFTCSLLGKKYL